MIGMAVRKDQRRNFLIAQMLARKRHGHRRSFLSREGINHNPSGLALNEGDVGQIKPTQLPNSFCDLEQTYLIVQGGLTPQTWIDRCRRVALNKGKRIKVPNDLAFGIFHLPCGCGNEASSGIAFF